MGCRWVQADATPASLCLNRALLGQRARALPRARSGVTCGGGRTDSGERGGGGPVAAAALPWQHGAPGSR
jgi:hypothetical protein